VNPICGIRPGIAEHSDEFTCILVIYHNAIAAHVDDMTSVLVHVSLTFSTHPIRVSDLPVRIRLPFLLALFAVFSGLRSLVFSISAACSLATVTLTSIIHRPAAAPV